MVASLFLRRRYSRWIGGCLVSILQAGPAVRTRLADANALDVVEYATETSRLLNAAVDRRRRRFPEFAGHAARSPQRFYGHRAPLVLQPSPRDGFRGRSADTRFPWRRCIRDRIRKASAVRACEPCRRGPRHGAP